MTVEELAKNIDPKAKKTFEGWMVRCVKHKDKTASLKLFNNGGYYCFGCGISGRAQELTDRKVRAKHMPKPERESVQLDLPMAWIAEMHDSLIKNQDKMQELRKMGIGKAAIVDFKVGLYESVTYGLPVIEGQGKIVALRLYQPSARKDRGEIKIKYWKPRNLDADKIMCQNTWFGDHLIKKYDKSKQLWICEGESDCLAAYGSGIQAISTTGGCMFRPCQDALKRLTGFSVVVAYDNDEHGNNGARRMLGALQDVEINAVRGGAPIQYKDVRQWILAIKEDKSD